MEAFVKIFSIFLVPDFRHKKIEVKTPLFPRKYLTKGPLKRYLIPSHILPLSPTYKKNIILVYFVWSNILTIYNNTTIYTTSYIYYYLLYTTIIYYYILLLYTIYYYILFTIYYIYYTIYIHIIYIIYIHIIYILYFI